MKSLLLATDFSNAATNAAHYAAKLSSYLSIETLVIYHSYDNAATVVSEIPIAEEQESLKHEECIKELVLLEKSLKDILSPDTAIKLVTDNHSLLLGIQQLTTQYQSQLLIIGTTGKSYLENILSGSNALLLAQEVTLPLLLVPESADFRPLKKAVFATDLKRIDKTTPVNSLRYFIHILNLKLLVLNVSTNKDDLVADIIPEQYKLHDLLDDVHPEYHYIDHKDAGDAIINFSLENQADLIISIPKSHRFIENLFHRSTTKKLAFHSMLPLLLLNTR